MKPLAAAAGTEHLLLRLRRIEGQVRGLQRMVDRQESDLDVITQLVATRAALDAVGVLLLEGHLPRCGTAMDDGHRGAVRAAGDRSGAAGRTAAR